MQGQERQSDLRDADNSTSGPNLDGLSCSQVLNDYLLEHILQGLEGETKERVEAHLKTCADCWAARAILLTDLQLASEKDMHQLKQEAPDVYNKLQRNGRERDVKKESALSDFEMPRLRQEYPQVHKQVQGELRKMGKRSE